MARKFHRRQRLSAISEINLTPLIDLAFSLLIIFMVTTPLLEQTIALNLPIESHSQQDANRTDTQFQVISIDNRGNIFWGKQKVALGELDTLLQKLSTHQEIPVLDIRADRSVAYQKIVDVLAMVKRHNLTKISLDTEVQ
ncbi:hypothetical protein AYO37_00920 [Opitutia bacterium SCGC AG-212-L18]|nr:hypothetical protein AYO37_00920 [Opitutae bacterium SCGC AG-212-L18]